MDEVETRLIRLEESMSRMETAIERMADGIEKLTEARIKHDHHEREITHLRERQHAHANMLQSHEIKIANIEKLPKKIDDIVDSENDMKVTMAKNSVISGIVSAGIVVFITYALNH